METPNPGNYSTIPNVKPRHAWMRLVILLLAIIVVSIIVCRSRSSSSEKVIWLRASDLTRSSYSGPLRALKYKVERLPLISSLVQHYRKGQPRIMVNSLAFTLQVAAADRTSLGIPVATNADGMRVWILTSSGRTTFARDVVAINRAPLQNSAGILVLNGNQGSMSVGASIPIGTNSIFAGLTAEVAAKVIASNIKLSAIVTETEAISSDSSGIPTLKTNFSAACQAIVPFNGALVMGGADLNPKSGLSHWIMFDVSAMDDKGQMISGKP